MKYEMKKLIILFVLVAFAGTTIAELYSMPMNNADFEAGMSGWSSWGSGSGSGSSGYKWTSHWAYIDTTGNGNGGSNNFMVATTAAQAGYSEWWGWGYDVIWRNDTELLDWSSGDPCLVHLDWGGNPGAGVTMGAWMKDLGTGGASGAMTFEWVDWSGGDGGGGGGGTIPRQEFSFAVTTDWAYYEVTLPIPVGAYAVRTVWGVNNPGHALGIDDVGAWAVPEPMTIALLGFGALALRRRK